MRIRLIFVGLCVSLLVSCNLPDPVFVPENFDKLRIGMPKNEVVRALGEPDELRAAQGVEYLIYRPSKSAREQWALYSITYRDIERLTEKNTRFVRIVRGKVDAYGELGDFGSAEAPGVRIDQNLNIRSQ